MDKQKLASKIWESANKLRSKIEANEYKDYILGLIFYKFLSDKLEKYLKNLGEGFIKLYQLIDQEKPNNETSESDELLIQTLQKALGYFIEPKFLFSAWVADQASIGIKSNTFSVRTLQQAITSFNLNVKNDYKIFKGIFDSLQQGLTKLGSAATSQSQSISDLLVLIKDIPMQSKHDYDVLGFIYEYLISNFAANAGKKAGEFYTPHEVSLLMSELVASHIKALKDAPQSENEDYTKGLKIYDPTSGSASLLINIGSAISKYIDFNKYSIDYYAQELITSTYNLTRMNLIMRGIPHQCIYARNADTLERDWPEFDEKDPENTYIPLHVDAVVSNPPYSQHWNPDNKKGDIRYLAYGLAPKAKADYAFLLHDLFHLKPSGIMTIVLPHGVLFRGNEEGNIRKNLIEKNHIDTIIGLPANIFFGTGIPTLIMVLKQKREQLDILFIDASNGYEKVGKNNQLRARDIRKIVDVFVERKEVPEFSRVVSKDLIRDNDYNLNISRYIDHQDNSNGWDLYGGLNSLIPNHELDRYQDFWNKFVGLKDHYFELVNNQYSKLKVNLDVKSLLSHESIKNFIAEYNELFNDYESSLIAQIITPILDLDLLNLPNLSRIELSLGNAILEKLKPFDLVDPYEAYQIFCDHWKIISEDLEIIINSEEKIGTVRIIDLTYENKKGKDVLVAAKGRIIPIEQIQNTFFKNELESIDLLSRQLQELKGLYEEELANIPEDERFEDFINEEQDGFIIKAVKDTIKKQSASPEILEVLKRVVTINEKEKQTNETLKQERKDLENKTYEKYGILTIDEIKRLLIDKWLTPYLDDLFNIPNNLLNEFSSNLQKIVDLYCSDSLPTINQEIDDTQNQLFGLFDDLDGNEFDALALQELKKFIAGDL